MIRVVLTMTVAPRDAGAFEAAWQVVAELAGRQPNCLGQTLVRKRGDEYVYLVCSDWTDPESFRAFERSDSQDVATAELRRLRTSTRMDVYDIVDGRHRVPD